MVDSTRLQRESSRLSPCPGTPNCVSSDERGSHFVEPLKLAAKPEVAWREIRDLIKRTPQTRIVSETDDFLHVEFRVFLTPFIDDVELELRASESIVAIRSSSRVGTFDLGLNRRRVEELRRNLRVKRVVR